MDLNILYYIFISIIIIISVYFIFESKKSSKHAVEYGIYIGFLQLVLTASVIVYQAITHKIYHLNQKT